MEEAILRIEFRGVVAHTGDWPQIGQEVTVIGRGVVTGETTDEDTAGPVTRAKLRMTEGEIAIVPPPPGLFDDLNQPLPDLKHSERTIDPETGEIG